MESAFYQGQVNGIGKAGLTKAVLEGVAVDVFIYTKTSNNHAIMEYFLI